MTIQILKPLLLFIINCEKLKMLLIIENYLCMG